MSHRLRAALPASCPIGVVLEGGYDLAGLEGALAATLDVLAGGPAPETIAGRIGPTHEREIARARSALSPYWPLG
jgi:hypothetical protein